MKKFVSKLYMPVIIVFSFIAGYAFYHYSVTIWDPVYQGNELTNSKVESLRQEAITFFYQTMNELFEGICSPKESYVTKQALNAFNKYRLRLEPKCRLVNVYFYYGVFSSELLFPSGDRFEVVLIKTATGWRLDSFNHLGSEPIYYDLKEKR